MDGPDQRPIRNVLRLPQLHGYEEHRMSEVVLPTEGCDHWLVHEDFIEPAALCCTASGECLHREPDAVEETAPLWL